MEHRRFLLFLFYISLLSFGGLYLAYKDIRTLFSSLTVNLSAELTLGREITLEEKYTYNVREENRFRVLYRFWKVPLTFSEFLKKPHIELLRFEGDISTYAKDYRGRLMGHFRSEEDRLTAKVLGLKNEVGLVDANFFKKGFYFLKASYLLVPEIYTNRVYSRFRLLLADEHVYYPKVEIKVKTKGVRVLKIHSTLLGNSVERTPYGFLIRGYAPENHPVVVEILTPAFPAEAFFYWERNPLGVFEEHSKGFAITSPVEKVLELLLSAVLIITPFFVFYIYRKYGTEVEFLVPKYLSFLPNKRRKPYEVNMLFCDDAAIGDENGFYATLLDLQERGYIKITKRGNDLIVEILKTPTDKYEKAVVEFLKKYGTGNLFSVKRLLERIKREKSKGNLGFLRKLDRELFRITHFEDEELLKQHVETKGEDVVKKPYKWLLVFSILLIVALIFFPYLTILCCPFSDLGIDRFRLGVLDVAVLLVSFSILITPAQFFGRWKGEFYKEKLQWEAFKKFLEDMVKLGVYKPEDVKVWKEWLIYGTALGVADKVAEAYEKLFGEKLDEALYLRSIRSSFDTLSSNISSATSSSSSGGGGGGGFGGGGAGGR